MQRDKIRMLERFNENSYAEIALEYWQEVSDMRERRDSDRNVTNERILRNYAISCKNFIKHIFVNSLNLSELMSNIDWVKGITSDKTNIEGKECDTMLMRTLIEYHSNSEVEAKFSELFVSLPYESVDSLYNSIDELLLHLYNKSKEIDNGV